MTRDEQLVRFLDTHTLLWPSESDCPLEYASLTITELALLYTKDPVRVTFDRLAGTPSTPEWNELLSLICNGIIASYERTVGPGKTEFVAGYQCGSRLIGFKTYIVET